METAKRSPQNTSPDFSHGRHGVRVHRSVRIHTLLLALIILGLAFLMDQFNTSWAQPNQSPHRDTIDTIVPTPTNGPTATGTAKPGPCTGRILLQQGLDGYTGTTDTWMYAWDANWPQSGSMLRIKGGESKSVLIRFDLANKLPAGATIIEAELVFYLESGERIRPLEASAYRVLRPWSDTSATWNSALPDQPWGSPGCNQVGVDRVGTPDDTATLEYRAVYQGLDVTDSVRHWAAHPSENYGWLIKGAVDSTGEFLFHGSEWKNAYSPILRIDYDLCAATPTPTPTGTSHVQVLVYEDANRNGQRDPGEQGIPNAVIHLFSLSWQMLETQSTDQDGTCLFTNRHTGEYRLKELNAPWYCSTTDDIIRIYHGSGQTLATFGDYRCLGLALPILLRGE